MTDLTRRQLEMEFARQVNLCHGVGPRRQLELVIAHFTPAVLTAQGKREWLLGMLNQVAT